jgi:hypothetical protein
MVLRYTAMSLLMAVIMLGIVEYRRIASPLDPLTLTDRQKVRRVAGFVLLCIVFGMTIGGTYMPTVGIPKRAAALQLLYWLVAILFAAVIPIVAVAEMKESIERLRRERREMVQSLAKPLGPVAKRNGHSHVPEEALDDLDQAEQ